jgi:hypothetical protein
MIPIFEQVSGRGQGLGHDDFKRRFRTICEEHLQEKRARIFAFVFYDMNHGIVREALRSADGFRRLDEVSGKDVSLFYLHDRAIERHGNNFNQRFLRALNIQNQAKPPCMVVFKFEDSSFVDGTIFPLDYENKDAVTVANDMVHFLRSTIESLNKEGDLSGLTTLPAAAMKLIGLAKSFEYLRSWCG